MRLFEFNQSSSKIDSLNKFAKWAIDRIGIENPPTIKFGTDLGQVQQRRTFGSTTSNGDIWVHIKNRNTADVMRTLMHELVHHKQFLDDVAHDEMDEERRQYIEDEANALAGRLMREYGSEHEEIYETVQLGLDKLR